MIVAPCDVDLGVLRVGQSGGHRATGCHMSDIYNRLFQKLEPKRYRKDRLPDPELLEVGLLFESMLEEGLKRKVAANPQPGEYIERPAELVTTMWDSPVYYNPDLFIHNGLLRVGEIKATYMSLNEWPKAPGDAFPPKADKYLTQLKLYCRATGTRFARLYVFFIVGDYSRPFIPKFRQWDIEFTQDELDEEWGIAERFARSEGLL